MRRSLLTPLLLLAFAAPAAAQSPPPLAATLAGCNAGPTAQERFALFTGSMPAMAGTKRMAMRFDLRERRMNGTKGWRVIPAPKFGRWLRSKPGRSGFVYTKRVERLRQASQYQAIVRFRWYDADGRVQRETRRRTAACEQPDQRPDLRVADVEQVPQERGGGVRVDVTVVNDGATAAGAFRVDLSTNPNDSRTVGGLAAGDRATLTFLTNGCSRGDELKAVVDLLGRVDESNERNNAWLRAC